MFTKTAVNRDAITLALCRTHFIEMIEASCYHNRRELPNDEQMRQIAHAAVQRAIGKPDDSLADALLAGR